MARKVKIVLFAIVSSYLLMAGCLVGLYVLFQKPPPAEVMLGVKPGTEDSLILVDLPKQFPNAPTGSYVEVLKVQLLDGSYEHRVWAEFDDDSYQYFGVLQPQFGDFPVETLMLQIGDSRMIVGIFDEEDERYATHVAVYRSDTGATAHSPTAKYAELRGDEFFIPIQPDEVDEWSSIKRIGIPSTNGLGGLMKLEDRPTYTEKEFDPPFAIDGLLIPVDQQLAQKPTKQ
jgi:hypothetical protein